MEIISELQKLWSYVVAQRFSFDKRTMTMWLLFMGSFLKATKANRIARLD